MTDLEVHKHQMFKQVLNFAVIYAEVLSPSVYGGVLLAEMGKIVHQLDEHAMDQQNGALSSRQGTSNKASAREELREDLLKISRTARSIVVEKPGIKAKFRLARKLNNQQLLNTARVFAENAAPYKEDFIRLEMPKDFLEQLNQNIVLFEQAVNAQQQGITTQVSATAAIDEVIERGMVVVGLLDTIVRNKFDDDSAALAAWTSARHTERAPKAAPAQGASIVAADKLG